MPQTVIMKAKKIILNEEIKAIYGLYQTSTEQCTDFDQGQQLNNNVTRKRAGLWSTIVRPAEQLTGNDYGSKEILCPLLEYSFDLPGIKLRNKYIEFLNQLILEEKGVSSSDTVKEEISNKYIFIRELLIRMVTIALSVEENNKREGVKIIEGLASFVAKLNSDSNLHIRGWFWQQNKLSEHNKAFETEHKLWVVNLTEAARIIQLLHANSNAISHTLNFLQKNRLNVMRQLVANLAPKAKNHMFDDDWIEGALRACENKLLIEGTHNEQPLSRIDLDSQNLATLPNSERVKILYRLLEKTDFMIEMTWKIDFIITTTSWTPIILGILDLNGYSKIIQNYQAESMQVLSLKRDDPLFNQISATGLIKYEAITGSTLSNIVVGEGINFCSLQNGTIARELRSLISTALVDLKTYEVRLKGYQLNGRITGEAYESVALNPPSQLASQDQAKLLAKQGMLTQGESRSSSVKAMHALQSAKQLLAQHQQQFSNQA